MDNVQLAVNGNELTIKVDLSKRLGPSSTGKTTIIAGTHGSAPVPGFPAVLPRRHRGHGPVKIIA